MCVSTCMKTERFGIITEVPGWIEGGGTTLVDFVKKSFNYDGRRY